MEKFPTRLAWRGSVEIISPKFDDFYKKYRRAKWIASQCYVSVLQLAKSSRRRNIFIVTNTRGDKFAVITSRKFRNAYCTCKGFQLRWVVGRLKTPCKHILALLIALNEMRNSGTSQGNQTISS